MSKIFGKNTGDTPGTFKDYGGGTVPTGYLLCDGAAVSRTTYAALFASLGGASTPWGVGDGSTTFNVPDLRRRITVGKGGTVVGSLANTVGATGGAEIHTLTSGQIPGHTHSGNTGGESNTHTHGAFAANPAGNVDSGGFKTVPNYGDPGSVNNVGHTHGFTTDNGTGGGGSHNNLQPSAVVTKMIKY